MTALPPLVHGLCASGMGALLVVVTGWLARPLLSLWDSPKTRHRFHVFHEEPLCDRCDLRWRRRSERRRHDEMIQALRAKRKEEVADA